MDFYFVEKKPKKVVMHILTDTIITQSLAEQIEQQVMP